MKIDTIAGRANVAIPLAILCSTAFILSGLTKNAVAQAAQTATTEVPSMQKKYNGAYTGDRLNYVAFPMGGLGAGMLCLEGTGTLSHFSLRNKPEILNSPCVFAAICIKGDKNIARVLEGPVPSWKIFSTPNAGIGAFQSPYGLPRFSDVSFETRFPFATVSLSDNKLPLSVKITGWSPFIPGDADNSSLPVAALEYTFTNKTDKAIEAVFSFNARNFLAAQSGSNAVLSSANGFILSNTGSKDKSWETGSFCATVDSNNAKVDCAWFRGGLWFGFDQLTMVWNEIEKGIIYQKAAPASGPSSPGATIFVPIQLKPLSESTVKLMLSWYVPKSNLRIGSDAPKCDSNSECSGVCESKETSQTYTPWYAGRFADIDKLTKYWQANYDMLRQKSKAFSDCFYDTTLPDEVIEAIAANLTILKSPTVLRQTDGRLWGWEGCGDTLGCCEGSCTNVWNYAQAIPHLFPSIERGLRQTEFNEDQDKQGHQVYRAALPIRPTAHDKLASADGQLGGVMKVYRDWRISGDDRWLKAIWPKVKLSLNYCIETWDPQHNGVLSEPHYNTYDIEFWGPEPMCSSFYLGALKAAQEMGKAVGDKTPFYDELGAKGKKYLEDNLFNGEYFYQKVQWEGLRAKSPLETKSLHGDTYSPEGIELFKKEGPKYQCGRGCLSDGVIGAWMAEVCGVDDILDANKVANHLKSVHKYNFKKDLSDHANPQRSGYALGSEGGLLLCTWPEGGRPSRPFPYSDEVWTGIEYQVASHLMMMGMVDKGLDIVRTCRDRYDGRVRNPFDEYECGHWYARAMSSYAMLEGLSGARYDAVEKVLYLTPSIKGDFRSFLSTATGYGTVGIKEGEPFVEVKSGAIDIKRIEYRAGHKRQKNLISPPPSS